MTAAADRLIQDGCLVLYGIVGAGLDFGGDDGPGCFTAGDVVAALAMLGRRTDVTVRINSAGGIATEGSAIHAVLSAHAGRVTTVVEGVAASAASIIAMAGADRVIARGSLMMIHDPSGLTVGTADDHEGTAGVLRTLAASMASIYADATGRSEAEVRAEMRAETWFTAEDAVAKRYATRIGTASVPATAAAAFPFRAYAHAPAQLVALADARGWSRGAFTTAHAAGRSTGGGRGPVAPRMVPQAEARERAITEMCALAGQPERAAAFIASGKGHLAVLAELRARFGPTPTARQAAPIDPLASMRREIARPGLAPL
ncbi:head maturation protease, ClpP-related [Methylobacterium sp. CM6246]